MTVIAWAGSPLLDRIGASRATFAAPSGAATPRPRQDTSVDSATRVSLGRRDDGAVVYGDPRSTSVPTRVWSSPVSANDNVGALMARNRGANSYNLGDQWRGLGGALLNRFAQTGDNYTQTLVDDRTVGSDIDIDALPPEARAQHAAGVLAAQAADLAGVATNAPSAAFKIQTRSGQSVELKISVNGGQGGIVGSKVELTASGEMTAAERAAIAQLANGLDRALEGLGRDDAIDLDLPGLLGYDRSVIAGVDLNANNTMSHQPLGSFSLHLGDDRQSIALKGSGGDMHLSVDKSTRPGLEPTQQSFDVLQCTLDRFDGAADRSHANPALVEQMKSAFIQLQAHRAPDDDEPEGIGRSGPGTTIASTAQPMAASAADTAMKAPMGAAPLAKPPPIAVATDTANGGSQLIGLADFEVSFGGATARSNRFGTTHEAGSMRYELSQKTTTTDASGSGHSVTRAVSEQLSAEFLTASKPDAMLDVRNGDHSTTRIQDSRTVTTLVKSTADRTDRVLRKTDERQLRVVTDLEHHRVTNRQSWPSQVSFIDRLV